GSWANDVAVLRVNESFHLDGVMVAPICLSPLKSHPTGPVIVAGWGRTKEKHPRQPHQLHFTVLQPMSDSRCKQRFPYAFSPVEMFCAYGSSGRDTCHGDSGGAAAEFIGGSFFLRGLVSWGAGCARPHTPGVYTKIAPHYFEWIRETVVQLGSPGDVAQLRVGSEQTPLPPASIKRTAKPNASVYCYPTAVCSFE
ncbi:transmembrane protease serine 9-like, partial [Tropilaelaps mercedesae]